MVNRTYFTLSLGKHGEVLNLGLAERWGVVGDDHQLALAIPQGLEGLLVAKDVLAGLHDQGESGVDGLIALLCGLLLCSHGYLWFLDFADRTVTNTFSSLKFEESS